MTKKITVELLRAHGACSEQVAEFKRLFPKGVIPTLALAQRHAALFKWDWAAARLLSPSARAEYQRAIALALAEYERAVALALAECKRTMAVVFVKLWLAEKD